VKFKDQVGNICRIVVGSDGLEFLEITRSNKLTSRKIVCDKTSTIVIVPGNNNYSYDQ
jgi:hypothetical protein